MSHLMECTWCQIAVIIALMLMFGGCSTYHAQVGPWSEPVVMGKAGMPARRDGAWTQLCLCQWGPTRSYPVMAKDTCI